MPNGKAQTQTAALKGKERRNEKPAAQTRQRKTAPPMAEPAKVAQEQRPAKLRDMIALAIRQPYAEEILLGRKRFEFRSSPTNIRRRVLIYASLKPGDPKRFAKLKKQPGDLPTGVVVGSVEIAGCRGEPGDYRWRLERPRRLKTPIKPERQPQPVWFYPFQRGRAAQ
jgi:hypothetical protein